MKKFHKEDYTRYRLDKAKSTIIEIKVLLDNHLWNTAVNRMYYACFYAVGALLVRNGIDTSSHSGTRQKFGQLFINTGIISRQPGRHYSELFEKRIKGDYNDFFDIDQDTAEKLLIPSVELISVIEHLLLNSEDLGNDEL